MRKSNLFAASSLLAIAAASPALAQDAATGSSNTVEQVIVSASRINIAGYQQPTPVTVVDAAQLERDAQTDIADVIRPLPAFGTSSGPNNSSSANFIVSSTPGIDVVNLRQLGVLRTLVLFDGQRVVASSVSGGVDLSTMPSSLVQRVDVVTGGAWAARGSDAVAGVQIFCNQLTYANGILTQIAIQPINTNSQSVSGLDFQGDYQTEFLTGALDLHLVGNDMDQQTQTAAGSTFEYAGSIGPDSAIRGIPKFRTTMSATYAEGPWQGTVQGRVIGSAKLNNAWGPLDVDNNSIPAVGYLDLRASYK